jgi:hypothetical protein
MPLVTEPKANTRTRPPLLSGSTAGAAARSRSRPAPADAMLARSSVASVSSSPAGPQSSTWLLASTQQSIPAAARQGTFSGAMR